MRKITLIDLMVKIKFKESKRGFAREDLGTHATCTVQNLEVATETPSGVPRILGNPDGLATCVSFPTISNDLVATHVLG